jgi:hypothetical protein
MTALLRLASGLKSGATVSINLMSTEKLRSIPYRNGKAKCPKRGCGGDITYDASLKQRVPTGFGFKGSRFQIDYVVSSGWRGECMNCGTKVFAIVSQQPRTTYPSLKRPR